MKTRQSRRQTAKVSYSRWLAYAAAGAATALAGSNSAEAAIHYSGLLNVTFPPDRPKLKNFPLDQTGDYFVFVRGEDLLGNSSPGNAAFSVFGIVSAAFLGVPRFDSYRYPVAKLPFGERISAGYWIKPYDGNFSGALVSRFHSYTQWADPGVGFVGFRFNSGAGIQYGWARVRMAGTSRNNAFKLIDYAYADPGEAIRAGQGIRAGEDGQDMSDEQGPDEGSLGGLAVGAVGLLAWRKNRSRTAS